MQYICFKPSAKLSKYVVDVDNQRVISKQPRFMGHALSWQTRPTWPECRVALKDDTGRARVLKWEQIVEMLQTSKTPAKKIVEQKSVAPKLDKFLLICKEHDYADTFYAHSDESNDEAIANAIDIAKEDGCIDGDEDLKVVDLNTFKIYDVATRKVQVTVKKFTLVA